MNIIWTEKYRPKTLDEYVFVDESQKNLIEHWVKTKSIPHLLISGSPGVGKTTLAKILLNELEIPDYDIMLANGSKEARKIEWVDKLINFCQTMPFGKVKIVLIDEADYMNMQSVQPALRNLLEDYSDTVRFILTCNYPDRIMAPIHSRCQTLHIAKTDLTDFTTRVATILLNEQVTFDLDVLDSYVKATYPDLRKCLNLLESNSITGTLSLPSSTDKAVKDWKLDTVDLFKRGKVREARNLICQQGQNDIQSTFRWLYDNLSLWSDDPVIQDQAIVIICRGLANTNLVTDQEINLSATLIEINQLITN